MTLKEDHDFPWSLEQSAREGFGAAAWTKDDGSTLWIERSETGFEAAAFWGGKLTLGATWIWEGEPCWSVCLLSSVSGVHGEAMKGVRLSPHAQSKRVMEVMGAMAMGYGTFAGADWEEWKLVKAAGLGFAEKRDLNAKQLLAMLVTPVAAGAPNISVAKRKVGYGN